MIILMMLITVSCSNNDSVETDSKNGTTTINEGTKEEILREAIIQELTSSYPVCSFNVNDIEIISHEIDENIEGDYTVSVNAFCRDLKYSGELKYSGTFICRYTKINDNWQLVSCEETDCDFSIISCSFGKNIIIDNVIGIDSGVTVDDGIIDNSSDTVIFTANLNARNGYYVIENTYEATCRFDLNKGWYIQKFSPNKNGSWDILGEWSYNDSHSHCTLIVYSVTSLEIKCEYDYDMYIGEKHYVGSSDRIVSCPLYDSNESGFRFHLGDGSGALWLYMNYNTGFTASSNCRQFFTYDSGDGLNTAFEYCFDNAYPLLSTSPAYEFGLIRDTSHALSTYHSDWDNTPDGRGEVSYMLYGQYKSFSGFAYLTSHAKVGTHAVLKIYGDGRLLYECDAASFKSPTNSERFSINVEGVKELTISLPGEYCTYRDGLGIREYDPVMALCQLIVSKTDDYECYDWQYDINEGILSYTDWWESEKSESVICSIYDFYYRAGVKAHFVTVPYDKSFFKLTNDFDYILEPTKVDQYAKNYAKTLNDDSFILFYFSDAIENGEIPHEYFYAYIPDQLKTIDSVDINEILSHTVGKDIIFRVTDLFYNLPRSVS